jgi:hypothetical protein
VNEELRAMTKNQRIFDRAVIRSSLMPSAKYSCSESPDMLSNGSTAIEGLSGKSSAEFSVEIIFGSSASSISTRYARTGSSMFFTFCSPMNS